ncbi:hypothetical protein, partial [Acinetobacter baumannii]
LVEIFGDFLLVRGVYLVVGVDLGFFFQGLFLGVVVCFFWFGFFCVFCGVCAVFCVFVGWGLLCVCGFVVGVVSLLGFFLGVIGGAKGGFVGGSVFFYEGEENFKRWPKIVLWGCVGAG